jgi:magnesium chelatase subunit H
MQSRITAADPVHAIGLTPEVRVVIVTLDNHLAGAVAQAATDFAPFNPQSDHRPARSASEFGSDPVALEACKADIARAISSSPGMLFVDDHIQLVQDAIAAEGALRSLMTPWSACLSAAEVVKLTRMGA